MSKNEENLRKSIEIYDKETLEFYKKIFDNENHLIDYFLVCGVDPSFCLDLDLYDFNNPNYEQNINSKLKPKIITKFPDFNKSSIKFSMYLISTLIHSFLF